MFTICLDPGHYGKSNAGAIAGYWESEIVWKLTQYEKEEILKYDNVDVIITRSDPNKDLELTARGHKAKGCVFLESNHTNAVGEKGSPDVNYAAGIYLADDKDTNIDEKSRKIANAMTKAVADCMGIPWQTYSYKADWDRNRDGKMNDEYYGINQGGKDVNVPTFIEEHGFHTNPATCRWLMKDANLRKLAKVKAQVWADELGLKLKKQADPATYYQPNNIGTYTTTTACYIRKGAGVNNQKFAKLPKGTKLQCYGYWDRSPAGNAWMLVVTVGYKETITGYVAKKWMKKS